MNAGLTIVISFTCGSVLVSLILITGVLLSIRDELRKMNRR